MLVYTSRELCDLVNHSELQFSHLETQRDLVTVSDLSNPKYYKPNVLVTEGRLEF